ncbi:hypothetical protein LJC58_03905 [Lachnospiraceae bacterium OttesenSCG-928-D06]|nr:hypothetical protein [Lachnospiraceae bacterium OttesenSCG-928-D06]
MVFLGTTFFSGRNTLDPSLTKATNIEEISIQDGTFGQIFASKNPNLEVESSYDNWDFDTILNADYSSGNLDAGNSGFSLNNTDTIIIRCRKKGTMDWMTIYTKSINNLDDFNINIKDYFRPSKTVIEYMIVSLCNGIENSYVTQDVFSDFDCLCICDKDNIYGTIYDLDYLDTTMSSSSTTIEMLNSEYPTVINNSPTQYESSSTSGSFIKFDQDNSTIDLSAGLQLRDDIKRWLSNRKPKMLKFHDGRIWLIRVTGNITDSGESHNDRRKIGFDWVEIGKVDDMKTLYEYGLSDIGREWWYY